MERKDKIYTYTLAVLIGLAVALWTLALSGDRANAESVPSPTIQNLYSIESDGMKLSEAPVRLTILDIAAVDISRDKLMENGQIVAKINFPFVPDDGIEGIVLFDGYHLAHGHWIRAGENALIVTFTLEDIHDFDGTVGLYLILLGHAE